MWPGVGLVGVAWSGTGRCGLEWVQCLERGRVCVVISISSSLPLIEWVGRICVRLMWK